MKPFKALIFAGVAGTLVSGAAVANHRDWWPDPHPESTPGYVVVPPVQGSVVGYVTAPPAYYYEPAPRYYYSAAAPRYYYYEPAPAVTYYYDDPSAFPRSNSRD